TERGSFDSELGTTHPVVTRRQATGWVVLAVVMSVVASVAVIGHLSPVTKWVRQTATGASGGGHSIRAAGRAISDPLCATNPAAPVCAGVPPDARRPVGVSESVGGPAADFTKLGLGLGPDEKALGALDWARSQFGHSEWFFKCERFVEFAYG